MTEEWDSHSRLQKHRNSHSPTNLCVSSRFASAFSGNAHRTDKMDDNSGVCSPRLSRHPSRAKSHFLQPRVSVRCVRCEARTGLVADDTSGERLRRGKSPVTRLRTWQSHQVIMLERPTTNPNALTKGDVRVRKPPRSDYSTSKPTGPTGGGF